MEKRKRLVEELREHDARRHRAQGNGTLQQLDFQGRPPLPEPADPGPPRLIGDEPEEEELGILLSAVQPEHVEWLWPGWIPLGKLTIIDGDPGLGKSVLSLDIAARVSRGIEMPDRTPGRAGGVVLLSAEDGLADTVRPRLDAAGADCDRILALDAVFAPGGEGKEKRLPVLPDDVPYIQAAVERMQARLAVVDPLTAFLGSEINAHKDADCRRAFFPLAKMAADTGAAVVVIRHLNKGNSSNPLYRGGGSIGIIGAARSGLLVARDPDNSEKRILASTKCNLAKLPPSLVFDLSQAANGALRIGWQGESAHTAQSLLAVPENDEERAAVQEAVEVLRSLLAGGSRLAHDVKEDIGLKSSDSFFQFIRRDFEFFSKRYLQIIGAGESLTPDLEHIFYNAQAGFTLQPMLLLSTIRPGEDDDTIRLKWRLCARYLDTMLMRRVWNYRSTDQSTMKYPIFRIMVGVRHLAAPDLAAKLKEDLDGETEVFATNEQFALHGMNRRQIQRLLARITDYIETASGLASHYLDYTGGTGRKRYEVEHIWADKPERHVSEFPHEADFAAYRNRIGGLLLLPKSFNASYGDLGYEEKLPHYNSQNLLARSLHPQSYEHNPGFLRFIQESGLPFRPHEHFEKNDLSTRGTLYRLLADRIWNPDELLREAGQ